MNNCFNLQELVTILTDCCSKYSEMGGHCSTQNDLHSVSDFHLKNKDI